MTASRCNMPCIRYAASSNSTSEWSLVVIPSPLRSMSSSSSYPSSLISVVHVAQARTPIGAAAATASQAAAIMDAPRRRR
jgi:hypothetical protein